jgi:hypothetical protein
MLKGRKNKIILIIAILLLPLSVPILKLGVSLFKWKAYIWVYDYTKNEINKLLQFKDKKAKHVIFVMVDHYEQGVGEKAIQKNNEWCDKFKKISDTSLDSYGNRFKYSWFYGYDHHNEDVLKKLSEMAYEGYGEVEMHWHLSKSDLITVENYGDTLKKAIAWFQKWGALITSDSIPKTAFAYIAGNWDLDASRKPQSHGVTNQIEQLFKNGCYADFTYSTIGTAAQPSKVNSIYYCKDIVDKPKSYNTGSDVSVGKPVDSLLMIFEGPISIGWSGALEYGAVENDPRFKPERIKKWIDAGVHVKGNAEWVFVKVYSHGAQSAKIVLDNDMALMLKCLKAYCNDDGYNLHYMTAREAYNVVKAAEAGENGDPENYRNYKISKYRNMLFR